MKIPKKIKLFGHTYKVKQENNWHDETAVAKIYFQENIIRMNTVNSLSTKEEALLHEIIEGINYHIELKMEHNQITGLSEALYMILEQNKLWG